MLNKLEHRILLTILRVAEGKVPGLMPEARFRVIVTLLKVVMAREERAEQ